MEPIRRLIREHEEAATALLQLGICAAAVILAVRKDSLHISRSQEKLLRSGIRAQNRLHKKNAKLQGRLLERQYRLKRKKVRPCP